MKDPSARLISRFQAITTMSREAKSSGADSRLRRSGPIDSGVKRAVKPRTRPMLAILLPITFPIASSGLPSKEARRATASSGVEVPNAMTVAPIAKGLIFRTRARRTLLVTR